MVFDFLFLLIPFSNLKRVISEAIRIFSKFAVKVCVRNPAG
jgi:hypothetical protein